MSWDWGLEHPDIECANRTGYPRGHREPKFYCEECGKDITEKHQYFDHYHKYLCVDCLLFFHERDD